MKKIYILIILVIFIGNLTANNLLVEVKNEASVKEIIVSNNFEIAEIVADKYILNISEADLTYFADDYRILHDLSIQRELSNYRSYSEIISQLEDYALFNPDIIELEIIGITTCHQYFLEGNENYSDYQHNIYSLKISDNPAQNEDEPNVYFAGGIHAREPISIEVTMHILDYLITEYNAGNQQVIDWINSTQIWFFPLMNPDGYKIVYEQSNTMHRKNLRDNNLDGLPSFLSSSGNSGTASTVDGVDLNRNWGYVWGPNGTSQNTSSSLYNGPHAWSEIEVIPIRDIIRSHKFYGGITYHSYGQYVLYPLGHLPGSCSYDHLIMDNLATQMANTIPLINGNGVYDPRQAVEFGYTCQGTMGDWGYAEQRIFSFTIELANTYIPNQVEEICQDNLEAALIFLDRINYATITGNIFDENGNPLEAEIYVNEIDFAEGMSEVEPVRSGANFGRFYRLLNPGNYNLLIQHELYDNVEINDVVVTVDAITDLGQIVMTSQSEAGTVENLRIEIIGDDVHLNWDEVQTAEILYYKVEGSNYPSGQFEQLATTESNSFIHQNATNNFDKYFYRIRFITE